MKKRVASVLLALLMVLSLLSVQTWATEPSLTEAQQNVTIGNVNGVGEIDISDLDCLYAYLTRGVNIGSLSDDQFQEAADLNKDHVVDIYDLQLLYEVVSGSRSIHDLPGGKKNKVKIGFICLDDENSMPGYCFINDAKAAIANLGLTEDDYILKTNVPEGQECYEIALELVEDGCNLIFGNSYGYEAYMLQAANEFPNVQFCHFSGTRAHTEGLPNYHNAFASIYDGRYLAGIAAGMKLNEMIAAGNFTAAEAKIGFVASFAYSEVVSAYTAFYLGARSVCPTVTMDVTFTEDWYDEQLEKTAADTLIARGCKLISQTSSSMGAPVACENAGVPNVACDGCYLDQAPNTYIISSRINWTPYFEYAVRCVQNGNTIATDWTGTLSTGSVVLTELNTAVAAAGTAEAIKAAAAKLESGELHVFDCSTFTVGGTKVASYWADVDDDPNYSPDTQVVVDGHVAESFFRSAPYFNLHIDGITLLSF